MISEAEKKIVKNLLYKYFLMIKSTGVEKKKDKVPQKSYLNSNSS